MTITIELQSDDLSLIREAIYSRKRVIDGLLYQWSDLDTDDAYYLTKAYSKDKDQLIKLENMLDEEYKKELLK